MVRDTPNTRASSDPSAATAAPTCTTGTIHPTPALRTASVSGAVADPNRSAPSTDNTATATAA